MRFIYKCVCTLILFCWAGNLKAQDNNDGLLITEARVAMEKHNDCETAVSTLKNVSAVGKKEPLFLYYMAKACECSNDLERSLFYYKKYSEKTSMSPEMMEKIADLGYRIRKRNSEQTQLSEEERKRIAERSTECTGHFRLYFIDDYHDFPFSYSASNDKISFTIPVKSVGNSFQKYSGTSSINYIKGSSYIVEGSGTFISFFKEGNAYKELDPQVFEYELEINAVNDSYVAQIKVKLFSPKWVKLSGIDYKDIEIQKSEDNWTSAILID